MSKAMSGSEFVEFATGQIRLIDQGLAEHQPAGGFCCSCGQTQPCPHQEMLELRRRHYVRCIAAAKAARPAAPTAGSDVNR